MGNRRPRAQAPAGVRVHCTRPRRPRALRLRPAAREGGGPPPRARQGPAVSSGRLAVTPPLPFDVYLRTPAHELPFPLDRADCVLFHKGRQALWYGLSALRLEPSAELLVPAYN